MTASNDSGAERVTYSLGSWLGITIDHSVEQALLVLGASRGGTEAIKQVLTGLPGPLPGV